MRSPMRVVVLGSLVFDMTVNVERVPRTHETVLASGLTISGGGKGLCQAVAARRLGADVDLIGRLGADVFGDFLLDIIDAEGIQRHAVQLDPVGTHIGIPIITLDGNNRIIGVPRASGNVSAADVDAARSALARCEVLLLQGETPLAACHRALELIAENTVVVWNPAPATFALKDMLGGVLGTKVTWLTPNETEATTLTGLEVVDPDSALAAARMIQDTYRHVGVVVTLGDRGSVAVEKTGTVVVEPPFAVDATDPTAAGDTFSAAFGVALARSTDVDGALTFASAAGALTATRLGAVLSIPHIEEVSSLIETRKR
ncbi:ribokinase [Mycobacterium sp. 1274761.0]|uniref:ribokinase n=1 Tax=Mycobacterium sp. 1274761.0 TaxID=1834077 RepID=UPI001E5F61F4|nr:ribokinase [Mycobacterium sp. 1274761.0]